ncbi:hypothetical protein BGZ80_005926 [Entomortierella chlamydospora]|uniref:Uncharacterized protein n=1 Tax=Entomortierella chlamydospora TaxID=101097 RepID=A0A9P6T292_9FUNG|nr:hypothetical protein BGZ80_005926 [Entomortierella chlamydospora]
MPPTTPRTPWRKLLYVKQEYPDNHVDDTFLEELQKNANVRHYEYWSVVMESTIISQHISSIVIFVAIFIYLYFGTLSSHDLITLGTVGTAVGYGFWDWSNTMLMPDSNYQRRKIFKGALLFFLTLLGLTPILKTLTEKTSEDTIWALTVILFLANLAFHDYGSGNRRNIKYPGSLSTNAAIFASVVLASRLKTNLHVFGLMSFAVEWFALFPMLRRQVRSISNRGNLALTIVLFLTATTLFSQISPAIVVIYILGMAFLTFVCPFWLIWIQRYKNEIHGPWDEARPKIQHGRSGIFYMLRHPSLFKNIICPILLTIVWGIGILIFGLAFLLKLQAHALIAAKCPAAVAWIVCIIFVLLEVGVLSILFYLIILPIYQDGLFDRVLKLRGLKHVLHQNEGNDMAKCMRGVHGGLWILLLQISVLVLTFPVNFVPVLGQIVYFSVNGWILTFGLRFYYDVEIRNFFGAVAVGFEMIPIANILFMWTNIVGSALWVADEIEIDMIESQQETSQSLMGQIPLGHSPVVDAPPEYTPGNHFNMSELSGQQQYYAPQQQRQQYQNQPQDPFNHQGSSNSPYARQGSPMIPPKNKKHPDLE